LEFGGKAPAFGRELPLKGKDLSLVFGLEFFHVVLEPLQEGEFGLFPVMVDAIDLNLDSVVEQVSFLGVFVGEVVDCLLDFILLVVVPGVEFLLVL
jgi:hypothetical protein